VLGEVVEDLGGPHVDVRVWASRCLWTVPQVEGGVDDYFVW